MPTLPMRQIFVFETGPAQQGRLLDPLRGLAFSTPKENVKNSSVGEASRPFGVIIDATTLATLPLDTPPQAVLLRDVASIADVERCSARLAVFEARHAIPEGTIAILAAIGDTPASVRLVVRHWPEMKRLAGLVFIAERLCADFGVAPECPLEEWPEPIRFARALTVLKAKELGLPALIWTQEAASDPKETLNAQKDGFSGSIIPVPLSKPGGRPASPTV